MADFWKSSLGDMLNLDHVVFFDAGSGEVMTTSPDSDVTLGDESRRSLLFAIESRLAKADGGTHVVFHDDDILHLRRMLEASERAEESALRRGEGPTARTCAAESSLLRRLVAAAERAAS